MRMISVASVQFSSVDKSCLTLCNPMDWSTPGFPVLHYLLEFAQNHVLWVSDALQPSHPLSSPSPPELNLSQHKGLSIESALCDPIGCSTPGFPVLHYLLEFAQTHVLWVSDAIHPSHPLLPLSPPALDLSQHQGLFQWVSSSHQVAKGLELQLQCQYFQWIFRVYFL